MGIFTSEEKIREEIEKRLRAEMELEFTEAEKKAETLIYLAQEEANKIIKEAKAEAMKIKQRAQREIEEEKALLRAKREECTQYINKVKLLQKIVRQKNLANLRNLARSVPPARVKKEIIRANKQLIYLQDIESAMRELVEED